jgi:predicted membrane protein
MIGAALAIGFAVVSALATKGVIQHRERLRKIAKENEHLDVIPNDVKRASWFVAADQSDRDYGMQDHSGGDNGVGGHDGE